MSILTDADAALRAVPPNARIFVQAAAGESALLGDALERSPAHDGAHVFGAFLPGVNTRTYGAEAGRRVTSYFLTSELKAAGGAAFRPLGYTDIAAHLRTAGLDAALVTLSPPDADGWCSFGAAVDFLPELWAQIPIRIAHINPNMPRTHGHPGVRLDDLTACWEAPAPLPLLREPPVDASATAIAELVAALIPDGATLQVGIGKIPGVCMRALAGKRGLRLHSGFVGEWALDLMAAGAFADDAPLVTGVALGSPALYDAIADARFEFRSVAYTHSALVMSGLEKFCTLNAALELDLLGQAYAECGPAGVMSGPGGALDFARGAKLANGVRIITLPATARGDVSRIVAPGAGKGPVSLGRMDTDVIVTEHGSADIRGCTHDERAARLIAIAAPAHRAALTQAWAHYRAETLGL